MSIKALAGLAGFSEFFLHSFQCKYKKYPAKYANPAKIMILKKNLLAWF